MKEKSRVILPYEKPIDHEPGINPETDYLRDCPRCGEVRHRSWFRVEWPACAACMKQEELWIDSLAAELMRQDLHRLPPV